MTRLLVPLAAAAILACGSSEPDAPSEVVVEVGYVAVDRRAGAPVMMLEEASGERTLPIWIGFAEAHSIATEMEHRQLPRPNTHDLAKRLVDGLDGVVERVIVTELRHSTYYAIVVLTAKGHRIDIDARPSDAIALALRCGAPVYVRESLFEASQQLPPPDVEERAT